MSLGCRCLRDCAGRCGWRRGRGKTGRAVDPGVVAAVPVAVEPLGADVPPAAVLPAYEYSGEDEPHSSRSTRATVLASGRAARAPTVGGRPASAARVTPGEERRGRLGG